MTGDDMTLVREFAANHSEAAFATLVERHLGLVHSAALRQVSDPHLAEEISQAVFIILARKAASLGPKTILAAWLYRTARFAAADALKARQRRFIREHEAHLQSTMNESGPDVWTQLAPLLDEAMAELSETDRAALVLRYFENKTAREIAGAMRVAEPAAQKRVARALEKLRGLLARRGVALTIGIIASAVSANSVQAAPAGMSGSISALAATKGAAAAASALTIAKGALKIMTWTKVKTAIIPGICALIGTSAVVGYHLVRAAQIEEARSHAGMTQIRITGNPSSVIVGFYVQDGNEIVISNTLPLNFSGTNISRFEFHKLRREDEVLLSLEYKGDGVYAKSNPKLSADSMRVVGRIENGLITILYPN